VCKYVDAVHIGALHKDVDFRLHCAHKKCCQNCKIVSALLCFHKNTDLDWQMCRSCAGAWISERRKSYICKPWKFTTQKTAARRNLKKPSHYLGATFSASHPFADCTINLHTPRLVTTQNYSESFYCVF
jgi:hypothetical protein